MALSTWWLSDNFRPLPPIAGFSVRRATDDMQLARVNGLSTDQIQTRREMGHRPYIASYNGKVAAHGWAATHSATIGELDLSFDLPPGQRYLWDFGTLAEFRGLGFYPRLLQHILLQEQAERFWIIHAPENQPSGVGIDRAGFEAVGQLSFRLGGGVGLKPYDNMTRTRAGAALLGVPIIQSILSPCWCCGGVTEMNCGPAEAESCWPPLRAEQVHQCTCTIPLAG